MPAGSRVAAESIGFPAAAAGSADAIAFRYASYDVPFWARPNSLPGRWHRAGDGPTQYWALTPDAAWAELVRHEQLTTPDDLALVDIPFWVCRTPLSLVVDLRDPNEQTRFGLDEAALTSRSWSRCQEAGREIRKTHRGVLAPSAVLEGHANLTLFGPRRMIDWMTESRLASTVPAALLAIGRPPDEILGKVRPPRNRPDQLF